ncbi:unconventional myosin-Vc-like [Diaphorina citri]|uniref:non-specific serine/threonine protein kinase n=1 Tax=Diaphorina citri TaxID=121845 RepID=A0A1S3DBA5_DIACI|nr:unconventional myosin-Vc-like [Diaphorina citri]
MAEGIPVDLIEYTDNRPVLDLLLSRPMGLLALLDEESRFTRSTDRTLIEKFHANLRNKLYVRPKSNALCFGIQHFAGRVIYQVEGMLEKNRHFLAPEIIQLLRGSKLDTVRFLFQCPITKTGNLYSASPTSSGPDSPDSTKVSKPESSTNSTEFLGPYNFRQLLRPTQHPPTESLRRIARPSPMRKIILVQSCVRRWLAKSKYKRIRWEIASSVVTLQRYVRRWLQKQNQKNSKMETLDQKKSNMVEKENMKGFSNMAPGCHEQSNVNKLIENFSALAHVQAATIIQRHYRGYTVRRKWNQYNGNTNNKHPAKPTKDPNKHQKSHIK